MVAAFMTIELPFGDSTATGHANEVQSVASGNVIERRDVTALARGVVHRPAGNAIAASRAAAAQGIHRADCRTGAAAVA
jgi:hypothetical protein